MFLKLNPVSFASLGTTTSMHLLSTQLLLYGVAKWEGKMNQVNYVNHYTDSSEELKP